MKSTTVAELARRAGRDIDDTLVLLWEAGLESYTEATDVIPRREFKIAARALDVPTGKELTTATYWKERLRLSDQEFDELLRVLDIRVSPKARRLPKGAVGKLRRVAAGRPPTPREVTPSAVEIAPEEPGPAWPVVGHTSVRRLLTKEEVERIHDELRKDFAGGPDPIDPPGADEGLLASAVFRPYTSHGSETKYPTAEMATAALVHSLVHDHPFHNGNKRTALVSMIVVLDENGLLLTCTEQELFRFVLRLAQHQVVAPGSDLPDREVLWISEWIRQNTRNIEKGDRPIQWRRLKQVLRGFGCTFEPAQVGNRLNIMRRVSRRGRFGRERRVLLSTQVKYTDEGREATIDAVKKIRRDLELDDEHGVDSLLFYTQVGPYPDEFIVKYRWTLKRLARV